MEPENKGPEEQTPPARDAKGRLLPGHSGNPGGRPKTLAEVQALAREHAPRAIERLGELLELDLEEHGKVVHSAASTLLDRGYGKAPQPVTGEDGGPVKIDVVGLIERLKRAAGVGGEGA